MMKKDFIYTEKENLCYDITVLIACWEIGVMQMHIDGIQAI